MREHAELLICAALAVFGMAVAHVGAQSEERSGYKCSGSTNCADGTCTAPAGFNCANVTPINHPKCNAGNGGDCCNELQVECARLDYWAGGLCTGSPATCPGVSLGISDYLTELGCDTDFPCGPEDPEDPGGGGP